MLDELNYRPAVLTFRTLAAHLLLIMPWALLMNTFPDD